MVSIHFFSIHKKDGTQLFQLQDLSPLQATPEVDYNKILASLQEEGFDLSGDEEAVPTSIRYVSPENGELPSFHVLIERGQHVVLLLISNRDDEDLRQRLVGLAKEFEKVFPQKDIEKAEELLPYEKSIHVVTTFLAPRVIMDFFLPSRDQTKNQDQLQFEEDSERLVYERVNGFDEVADIVEKLHEQVPPDVVKSTLMLLWIKGFVNFQLRLEDWEVIERTPDANLVLSDGSERQKALIKKMGGEGRVVSVLAKVDKPTTVREVKRRLNLPDYSAKKYLNVLLAEGLIRLVPNRPKMYHVPESELPLLVIKGMGEEDVELLETLETVADGTKTVSEISLELEQNADRIERVLRLIDDYVVWELE
ncbi:MAG: hypothetical protein Kow0069_37360 [Promethearchaeota archaeon]